MKSPDETRSYRRTLFDRHGPAAAEYVRAGSYGLMIFGLTFGVLLLKVGFGVGMLVVSVVAGVVGGGAGLLIAKLAGGTWQHVMLSGASTPYEEQFSHQQALVMQRRIPEAIAAYEAVIAARPDNVEARMRAAELCAEHGQPERAAALFREVQRLPHVAAGSDIHASNRLVDLLLGPLGDPGRALVELRRIVDRHPGTRAAAHAREGIARIKADMHGSS